MIVGRGFVADIFVQGGDLGFGEAAFFLEADFAAAFVAVPEDEEENYERGLVRVGLDEGDVGWGGGGEEASYRTKQATTGRSSPQTPETSASRNS